MKYQFDLKFEHVVIDADMKAIESDFKQALMDLITVNPHALPHNDQGSAKIQAMFKESYEHIVKQYPEFTITVQIKA